MYVLKSDSSFENERFFASIPPFKFVFCSKCSVSKVRINNFGRRASIFQNVHISGRESLTLKKTLWQIQLALENWRPGDSALCTGASGFCTKDYASCILHHALCTLHWRPGDSALEILHSALETWRLCTLHWRPGDSALYTEHMDTWRFCTLH